MPQVIFYQRMFQAHSPTLESVPAKRNIVEESAIWVCISGCIHTQKLSSLKMIVLQFPKEMCPYMSKYYNMVYSHSHTQHSVPFYEVSGSPKEEGGQHPDPHDPLDPPLGFGPVSEVQC